MPNGHIGVTTNVAHGPYVFHVFAQTDDTADADAATIAKALDLQGPRIDQFKPTDPAQFATMNLDPTGMKSPHSAAADQPSIRRGSPRRPNYTSLPPTTPRSPSTDSTPSGST